MYRWVRDGLVPKMRVGRVTFLSLPDLLRVESRMRDTRPIV